jgi:hypothetical protein
MRQEQELPDGLDCFDYQLQELLLVRRCLQDCISGEAQDNNDFNK